MPVNSNNANQKNNNKRASDNMAFGMRIQVDKSSVIATLSKIEDPIVRVSAFKNIMETVTTLNENIEKLFKVVMNGHNAPKDLQPKDLEGFDAAVATLKLAESPEEPSGLWVDLTLRSNDVQEKCLAILRRSTAYLTVIPELFEKFANKFLEKSEIFQNRMSTVRAAAELEWQKIIEKKQ